MRAVLVAVFLLAGCGLDDGCDGELEFRYFLPNGTGVGQPWYECVEP